MKKIFPVAIVAVFCIIAYTSCQKHKSLADSHYCQCFYTSKLTGDDSIVDEKGFSPNYSYNGAVTQCALYQQQISAKQFPGITCEIQ